MNYNPCLELYNGYEPESLKAQDCIRNTVMLQLHSKSRDVKRGLSYPTNSSGAAKMNRNRGTGQPAICISKTECIELQPTEYEDIKNKEMIETVLLCGIY
ncbi:hypothetical protein TNCT_609861 [Trichonephila clavata]|uniref:Uncharacterized protein n=1 Tax=Trichonephila clavata TaxID=2740835 RepID=A0A8X6KUX1_TRICU|nr:hypothetical protein TNCT_609861 [Trichonephila clavata]